MQKRVCLLCAVGSASAVTAALQEVAVLASLAATTTITTAAGPDTTNSTGNATDTAASIVATAKVAAIQNALLTTLTTVMDKTDPAAMGTSLNAANAVSSVGIGLSTQAGTALLDVVDGFLSAKQRHTVNRCVRWAGGLVCRC